MSAARHLATAIAPLQVEYEGAEQVITGDARCPAAHEEVRDADEGHLRGRNVRHGRSTALRVHAQDPSGEQAHATQLVPTRENLESTLRRVRQISSAVRVEDLGGSAQKLGIGLTIVAHAR